MINSKDRFFTSLQKVFTESEVAHIWKEANHIGIDLNNDEILSSVLIRLTSKEPYQYVFGRAYFYDFELNVTSDVLIPRPETEELVELIVNDYKGLSPKVVDIGTGSGCIALSLAKLLPLAEVTALDVSPKALKVAMKNAKELDLDIQFIEQDILVEQLEGKYDIIVSNPPYIPFEEKKIMAENVLDFEPHLALFVDDEEPLAFYKVISICAIESLNKNGNLYFEINEHYGSEVKDIMQNYGFVDVEIIKDMQGKCRMVKGRIL